MKLRIDAARLRNAAAGSIAQRRTIPILEHMLLEAADGRLVVTTSDYEKWLTESLPAAIENAGEATVQPGLLKAALQGLEGEVELELTNGGGRLEMRQASRRFRFDSLPARDYERPMHGEWRTPSGMSADDLAAAIARCEYAMSRNDARHYLVGLALLPYAVAACDGHRAAIADKYRHGFEGYSLIVPAPTVPLIGKLLARRREDSEAAFECLLDKDRARAVRVRVDEATITSKLIDGPYPDMRQFLIDPDQYPHRLTVDGPALVGALNRLLPFSWITKAATRVQLEASEDRMVLTAGESSETLDCHCQGGFDLYLSPAYLRDVAQLADGPLTISNQDGGATQVICTFAGAADIHTIMPMR